MKTNKAFTLIELLVVVLIIGILAAIAVPQYQRAVEKSRAAQLITASKALLDANRAYYLQNGKYTNKLEDLDISFNQETGKTLKIDNQIRCELPNQEYVYCEMSKPVNISIVRHYANDKIACYSYKADDNFKGDSLCQIIAKTKDYITKCSEKWPCHIYYVQ